MRSTCGRSRSKQTERTVKNIGSNNAMRGIVQLIYTGNKNLIKQFSNSWSICARSRYLHNQISFDYDGIKAI